MSARSKTIVRLVVVAAVVAIVFPRRAHAYLDPGSANYMLQMLIAVSLSAAFLVKSYWAKLKSFFSGKKAQAAEDEAGDASTSERL